MSLLNIHIPTYLVSAKTVARRVGTKAVFGGSVDGAEKYLTDMQYRLKLYLAVFEKDYAWDSEKGDMNPRRIDDIAAALREAGTDKVWYLPGMSDEQCEQARQNLMALRVTA